jgi:hypothetical protein
MAVPDRGENGERSEGGSGSGAVGTDKKAARLEGCAAHFYDCDKNG